MSILVLLDLSAAFDTIDHSILFHRMYTRFGITGIALNWFKSYLTNRSQVVTIGDCCSAPKTLNFGVPQGSVLGPILFTIYTTPLGDIARKYNLGNHFYADDTQLYVAFDPQDCNSLNINRVILEQCIDEIKKWMHLNMLKLNDDKTEILLLGSRYNLKSISSVDIKIGETNITSVTSVGNLGAVFDSDLSMRGFVNKKCQSALYYLRAIRKIRKYLTCHATKTLVNALVTSRLDYGNSLLFDINKHLIHKLQLVQNSAARVVQRCSKYDHITPVLRELHWLPVVKRIEFKILCFAHNCFYNSSAPSYLVDIIQKKENTRLLRSNNNCNMVNNKSNTKFGDRAFGNCAPLLWNRLPTKLKTVKNIVVFKKLLKTHLFVQYFG